MVRKKWHIGIFIAVIVFLLQAIAVPHVGMTWDEPASFFIGRANLKFWLTRDRTYLTDLKNPQKFVGDPFQYVYGEELYPPFPFVIASGTSYIFSEHLHLLNFIDAHHIGLVAIGAVGVAAMYGIAITIGFSPLI